MSIPNANPIVAVPMVTPFDDKDQVDYGAAERNVERWLKTQLNGFIIGTQSGEEDYLSDAERFSLARAVSGVLSGSPDRFLIGGIDSPSVTETLRRAEAFAEAGAEMVRVRFPRNEAVVEPYFEGVLPNCPVPVLLMHQTAPASFGLSGPPAAGPEILGHVAAMNGVFGYVTDHDMRFEARVRRFVPADKRFWICNGSLILSGTLIGCNGTTTAFANIWPDALRELLELGMAGRYAEAQALQEKVRKVDEVMLPYLAAGVKSALKLLGFEGMVPRRPTPPMPTDEIVRLEQVMREVGLLG